MHQVRMFPGCHLLSPATESPISRHLPDSEPHLQRLEAHFQLLGAREGGDGQVVELLHGQYRLLHRCKIDEGVSQGSDAAREDGCVGQCKPVGSKDRFEGARCDLRGDVATPYACADLPRGHALVGGVGGPQAVVLLQQLPAASMNIRK